MPTPSFGAAGSWELKSPYAEAFDDTLYYTCEAIDGFDALLKDNVDIFTEFYVPYGIAESIYDDDYTADESIVTLLAPDGTVFKVPTSYIASYPDAKSVGYSHGFIAVDLGLLPTRLDMDPLLETLKQYTDAELGVASAVKLVLMPSGGSVSYVQHNKLEKARIANISYLENPANALKTAQATITAQEERIDTLQQAILQLNAQIAALS